MVLHRGGVKKISLARGGEDELLWRVGTVYQGVKNATISNDRADAVQFSQKGIPTSTRIKCCCNSKFEA